MSQHAVSILDGFHSVADEVFAVATTHELHCRWPVRDEVHADDTCRESEIIDAGRIDRRVKQVFDLVEAAAVVVPVKVRPHQERREDEWVVVQKQAPLASQPGAVAEGLNVTIAVQDL